MSSANDAEIRCRRRKQTGCVGSGGHAVHRSAVEIESIRMPATRKRKELQIAITVDGRRTQLHRMEASLVKLVDVLSVETILQK
jgi:acetolactate synthase small subunit